MAKNVEVKGKIVEVKKHRMTTLTCGKITR
jgi:hypothetical protein